MCDGEIGCFYSSANKSFMELLDEYIRFYNERRKKQSLGWMSPMQYRISKGLAAWLVQGIVRTPESRFG